MIHISEITEEVNNSKAEKNTSLFLTQLVFTIVDSALSKYYKEKYCMQCLQSSLAIQSILKDFGISSVLSGNDFCAADVFYDSDYATWSGFWDKDHHIWVISEFREIVDLTITRMYEHPSFTRPNSIPKPAIWWQDPTGMPHIIKYIPCGRIKPQLNDEDSEDTEQFLKFVTSEKNRILKEYTAMDIKMMPTLYNLSSLNYLHQKGHPWLVKVFKFQENNIHFPKWIIEKENENNAYFASLIKSTR